MATADKIGIEITARLTIPKETVEGCLKLIEMWLNDNPAMCIAGGARHEDGKVEPFKLERRK